MVRFSETLTFGNAMASSTEAVSAPAIADHPVRAALLLGALGVVFGDIGTSPIYAFREALRAAAGPSEPAVFGVLSLVVWAIVLVVAVKYVMFVMRVDNEGEGGTMALLCPWYVLWPVSEPPKSVLWDKSILPKATQFRVDSRRCRAGEGHRS
jgi:hypothetical protein